MILPMIRLSPLSTGHDRGPAVTPLAHQASRVEAQAGLVLEGAMARITPPAQDRLDFREVINSDRTCLPAVRITMQQENSSQPGQKQASLFSSESWQFRAMTIWEALGQQ